MVIIYLCGVLITLNLIMLFAGTNFLYSSQMFKERDKLAKLYRKAYRGLEDFANMFSMSKKNWSFKCYEMEEVAIIPNDEFEEDLEEQMGFCFNTYAFYFGDIICRMLIFMIAETVGYLLICDYCAPIGVTLMALNLSILVCRLASKNVKFMIHKNTADCIVNILLCVSAVLMNV